MEAERKMVPNAVLARRSFLRRVGIGAATAFVIADAGLAYRAYDEGVFSAGRGPAFDTLDRWPDLSGPEAIVSAAILASNAHNSQPWAFGISPDRIDVYADHGRSTAGSSSSTNPDCCVIGSSAVACCRGRTSGRRPTAWGSNT